MRESRGSRDMAECQGSLRNEISRLFVFLFVGRVGLLSSQLKEERTSASTQGTPSERGILTGTQLH